MAATAARQHGVIAVWQLKRLGYTRNAIDDSPGRDTFTGSIAACMPWVTGALRNGRDGLPQSSPADRMPSSAIEARSRCGRFGRPSQDRST